MSKKFTSVLLIIAIIIQLFVPFYMIAYMQDIKNNIDIKGIDIILEIEIYDFVEGDLFFSVKDYQFEKKYQKAEVDKKGIAHLSGTDIKPRKSLYIRTDELINPEVNRIYRNEKLNDIFYKDYFTDYFKHSYRVSTTARYKLYKGTLKLICIYIDGVPIETLCEE